MESIRYMHDQCVRPRRQILDLSAHTSLRNALLSKHIGPPIQQTTDLLIVEANNPAGPAIPYLNPAGTLVIPFESLAKFHYWNGGQQIRETLGELTASSEIMKDYLPDDKLDR